MHDLGDSKRRFTTFTIGMVRAAALKTGLKRNRHRLRGVSVTAMDKLRFASI